MNKLLLKNALVYRDRAFCPAEVLCVQGKIAAVGAGLAAAAFVLLAVLGQFGSVGLAGNGYPGPIFLLAASLAGWVLVRQAACRRRGRNSAPCWPTWAAPQCPLLFCIS